MINNLSLEEINRFFKLCVYDDQWIYGFSSKCYGFINEIEQGLTIKFDKYNIWMIIYALNSITDRRSLLIGNHLDYMNYSFPQYLDEEKIRTNLLLSIKQDQKLVNKINFVNLNVGNLSYWLLTLYNYKKITKYIKDEIEYYEVIYNDESKEMHKFCGISPKENKYQWDVDNLIITRISSRFDGMDFYRKVILKIETIYYFMVFNRIIFDLNYDVISQIKHIIFNHLMNKLYY